MKYDCVDQVTAPEEAENMDRFLALHEFEPEARERLPRAVYEYVAGGAGDEYSIRANEESYQRIFLRPRVLRSLGPVDWARNSLAGLCLRPFYSPRLPTNGLYIRRGSSALFKAQSATGYLLFSAQMGRYRSRRSQRYPGLVAGSSSTFKLARTTFLRWVRRSSPTRRPTATSTVLYPSPTQS